MSATSVRLQRHKSAHGRLQGSASLVPSAAGSDGREGGAAGIELEVEKGRSRRVKSARETKLEQERSDVFPPAEGKGAWGRTQYDDDFGKKQPFPRVPVRPVSPTRRNNPHPAKPFLQWKHPVRIHPHKKSVSPPEEAWKYIGESFYDDYIDTSNTGDAKNEVPVTNLATIEFPGNKKNGSLSSHLVAGTRAPLNPRLSHRAVHSGPGETSPAAVIRPPSPKSRMMHNTVRGNTLPVLREWLKIASNKERELVLQMLTAAHTDSEDTRLQKAVDDVLRPDSAARVQQWLGTASPSERKILLGVLETLAVAASSGPSLVAFPPPSWLPQPAPTHNHNRSYSYPITLRPKVSHHHHKNHTHTSSQYSRHSHHHHKHTCHKSHKISATAEKEGSSEGDMTLVGKSLGVKKGSKTPELWHHKIPGPVTDELRVIHPGSVFTQPQKYRGRHFSIHPEWPTA